jgi:hypothetical protein
MGARGAMRRTVPETEVVMSDKKQDAIDELESSPSPTMSSTSSAGGDSNGGFCAGS